MIEAKFASATNGDGETEQPMGKLLLSQWPTVWGEKVGRPQKLTQFVGKCILGTGTVRQECARLTTTAQPDGGTAVGRGIVRLGVTQHNSIVALAHSRLRFLRALRLWWLGCQGVETVRFYFGYAS